MKFEQKVMTPEELRKMQLLQLEILEGFDKVCRKHHIKYIMDAGTLLGAVRNKGFIPWDDDIDIRMLRSEYNKFCKLAKKELSKKLFFQNYHNDAKYPWIYSKVRMKGTRAVRLGQEKLGIKDGVFIDIFPCDGVPSDPAELKKHSKTAKFCRKVLYARAARFSKEKFYERMFWSFVCIIPRSFVYRKVESLAKKYNEKNCEKVGCIGWHAPKDVNGFKKEYFTELTELEFEGKMFLAPKDWDGFLRYSFGEDYMTPPPADKQTASSPLSYYDLGR